MAPLLKRDSPVHALVFPFPVLSHMNPMLHFASSLSSTLGIKVTFLITEHRLSRMQKEDSHNEQQRDLFQNGSLFSFYPFSDGLSAEDHAGPMAAPKLFGAMGKMAESDVFESVVLDLQRSGTAVNLIISDTLLSWTHFVAEKLGIPRVGFWVSCASSYLLHHHTPLLMAQGHIPFSESNDRKQMLELPGIGFLPADTLPSVLQVTDISDTVFNVFLRLFENDRNSGKLIVNSYPALEPEQFKLLKEVFGTVFAAGPLLGTDLLFRKDRSGGGGENRWMQMSREDRSCVEWLSSKPASSVLYVAFGSIVSPRKEELFQLAHGLESSKENFLWAMRGFTGGQDEELLPNGFLERTKERGLVISWAPQLEVLMHPSVGGFLTHCGWNSVMESLCCGVPLLAMPADFADLKVVAWLIEHVWKVGFQLKLADDSNNTEVVSQAQVETAVKTLMVGDKEGGTAAYRMNALKLRDAAKQALLPGGSSQEALQLLMRESGI